MAETSKIEWTDSTFNPWIGCTKIAPACDHCYAADMARRYRWAEWGNHPRQRTSAATWREPLKWQRQAPEFFAQHGRRRWVFCASLADVFDNQVPPEWRIDLWELIRATPDLDWLLLTKRPQNIEGMLPPFWDEVKGHVWLGTTVEDQEHADKNIPHLLEHDSAVRFISVEPMLGPVDLTTLCTGWYFIDALQGLTYHDAPEDMPSATEKCRRIDWVIAGGESGTEARPPHPSWFYSLRDQCAAAGVPFLFKQWGNWAVAPAGLSFSDRMAWARRHEHSLSPHSEAWGGSGGTPTRWHNFDDDLTAFYTSKKKAGRLLGGVEHNGFPRVP